MTDHAQTNPYEPSEADLQSLDATLTRLQRTALILLAVTLLFRGSFMASSWGMLLLSGFKLSDSFHRAIALKDAAYGVTALIGGLFLFLHPRTGWWAASIHWFWYIAWQVVIVSIAEAFSWQLPIRYHPPTLFVKTATSLVFALLALAVLFWKPTMSHCDVFSARRISVFTFLFFGSLLVALAVNWWSGLR